jgi:hypothetical protein
MDVDVKRAWVDDLRYGGQRQGAGYLRTEGGLFCPLGRLSELAVSAGVLAEPTLDRSWGAYRYPDGASSVYGQLPEAVMAWAGLRSPMGADLEQASRGHFGHPDIADANDDGMSFDELATCIEKWL